PSSADGTVGVTRWESRSLPSIFIKVPRPAGVAGLWFCAQKHVIRAEFPAFAHKTYGVRCRLAGAAAPGAEALDLASLGRRNVVRAAPHLAHEPPLLHLAAELPECLLELLGVLDYDAHSRTSLQVAC